MSAAGRCIRRRVVVAGPRASSAGRRDSVPGHGRRRSASTSLAAPGPGRRRRGGRWSPGSTPRGASWPLELAGGRRRGARPRRGRRERRWSWWTPPSRCPARGGRRDARDGAGLVRRRRPSRCRRAGWRQVFGGARGVALAPAAAPAAAGAVLETLPDQVLRQIAWERDHPAGRARRSTSPTTARPGSACARRVYRPKGVGRARPEGTLEAWRLLARGRRPRRLGAGGRRPTTGARSPTRPASTPSAAPTPACACGAGAARRRRRRRARGGWSCRPTPTCAARLAATARAPARARGPSSSDALARACPGAVAFVRLRTRPSGPSCPHPEKGWLPMGNSVYKVIEIVGTSESLVGGRHRGRRRDRRQDPPRPARRRGHQAGRDHQRRRLDRPVPEPPVGLLQVPGGLTAAGGRAGARRAAGVPQAGPHPEGEGDPGRAAEALARGRGRRA